jgi:putative phosphoesterase
MSFDNQNRRTALRSVEQVHIKDSGSFRLVMVSDTHAAPHHQASALIGALHPDAILHAGDVGEMHVLEQLEAICPVFAVHGNIDQRKWRLPDILILELLSNAGLVLRMVTVHVGVYGPRLRSEVAKLAQAEEAHLVVCGHSHVPFIGNQRGITIFNPGSMGPARSGLPIVFGMLDIQADALRLSHIDCTTGQPWRPPHS